MTILPVGDYRPDLPAYLGQHSTIAANVYFKPDGSVGPLKAGSVVTVPTSAKPCSAFAGRAGDGAVFLYIGMDQTRTLHVRNDAYFTDYTVSGVGMPTMLYPWRFAQFGNRVFMSHWSGGLWWHTLGSTDAFAQVTAAPSGAHIATLEPGFLMLGHLNDSAGEKPSSVRWSALNDATDWPIVGTSDAASKQADEQQLPTGGKITGILPAVGGAAGCVLTERAIYRVEYVGAPAVFAFREAARGTGNACPNACISVNGLAYFISEDGFQRFDGATTQPIGQGRVSSTFWAEVDRENLHRVYVAHDPLRKILVWVYPNGQTTAGDPNRWLIYSYATDKWTHADDAGVTVGMMFTAMNDAVNLDAVGAFLGFSLDGFAVGEIGYIKEGVLESPTLNGGAPILSGFNTSNEIVEFTGANIAARIETGETDAQGRRVYVSGARPLTDAGTLTVQIGHRTSFADSVSYTTAQARGVDYTAPARVATRYARARINIPAGATWSYLQGADVTFRAEGKR